MEDNQSATVISGPIPPQDFRDLVGTALTEEGIQAFWIKPLAEFDNMNAAYMWAMGGEYKQRVVDFINAAKSGDMS